MSSWLARARELYAEKGPVVIGTGTIYYLSRRHRSFANWLVHRLRLPWRAAEYRREYGAPVADCLKALRHGFDPKYYFFLGLDSRDVSKFVRNHTPIKEANDEAETVLNDKLAIYHIFGEYDARFPELYGTIHNGVYFSRIGDGAETLSEAVDRYGSVIAKPVMGYEGRGVLKIDDGGERYVVNGRPVTPAELREGQADLEEDYLVTEVIGNHEYASAIFPDATNTIRVLTAIGPDTGGSTVVRAIHRFGTERSVPTDNWENGGIAVPVDRSTGRLRSAIILDEDGKRTERDAHPDTNARVAGVEVPMWDDVEAFVETAHRSYPVAKLIGWDVVVTGGGPMLLEASGRPGSHMLQLERGLLEDDVVRRVFEREGVTV